MFTITRHLIVATALAFQAATALPAAGPNDDAEECRTSQDAYRLSVEYAIGHSYTELVSTEEWVSTSTDSDVPLTTLCDGKARALEPYKTVLVTVTETLETPTLTTFTSEFTGPSPTCTIGESECSAIVDAHPTDIRHSTFSKTYPPCAATSAQCDVWDGGHSTLLYWPVSTQSGDFCAQNGTTAFAMPTSPPQPNTAVIDGFTFTSPTNYISFDALSAGIRTKIGRSYYRLQCGGPPTRNVVIPITGSLSSSANYATYGESVSYSFNFADLNTVPAEAYSRQAKCGYNGEPESCSGVMAYQASYTPIVYMPGLNHLDPEWKAAGCGGPEIGFSLTQVALATPTPP